MRFCWYLSLVDIHTRPVQWRMNLVEPLGQTACVGFNKNVDQTFTSPPCGCKVRCIRGPGGCIPGPFVVIGVCRTPPREVHGWPCRPRGASKPAGPIFLQKAAYPLRGQGRRLSGTLNQSAS